MALEVIKKLAISLDNDDFETLARLLSSTCIYEAGSSKYVGPSEIVGSYKEHTTYAKATFDEVKYESSIQQISDAEFEVTYVDIISKSGKTHVYRCKQLIKTEDKLISHIRHEEIPGEMEKIRAFYMSVGVS